MLYYTHDCPSSLIVGAGIAPNAGKSVYSPTCFNSMYAAPRGSLVAHRRIALLRTKAGRQEVRGQRRHAFRERRRVDIKATQRALRGQVTGLPRNMPLLHACPTQGRRDRVPKRAEAASHRSGRTGEHSRRSTAVC